MKKFTLTLIAALFVVGGAFSQVDKAKVAQRFVSEPQQLDAQDAPESKPGSRRGTFVVPFDGGGKDGKGVIGAYSYKYKISRARAVDPASVEATEETGKVLITLLDADPDGDPNTNFLQVRVDGLAFYDYLTAYYYPDEDILWIPQQSYASYTSNYGWCQFAGLYYSEEAQGWYIGGVEATVKEGTIDFGDYWFTRVIQTGVYQGYSLTPYVVPGGDLVRNIAINGVMEVTFDPDWTNSTETKYPVILSQEGNTLTVDGFVGEDIAIDMTLNADKSVTINPWAIYYDDNHGYYYLATVNWASGRVLGWGVIGQGTPTVITLGNFTGLSEDYYITDAYASAKIYYIDGAGRPYNYADPAVAASAPRFGFGGGDEGTTGIQAAKTGEVVSTQYVDMAGRKVTAATKGLVLKTVTYADGTKKTVKVINK